jgi:ubiquinone/menaquinone biosynthesis C-methylase UbiE
MNDFRNTHLHPVEKASALEGRLRLFVQNPGKMLKDHVRPGMTVLDLGCGTGFFTLEMARLLVNQGKVIAVDVQNGMLDILKIKLRNSDLQRHIEIHKSESNSLGLTEKVDFILAFYSFHEMKDIDSIIIDLIKMVKPETRIFISEQKIHVSKVTFNAIIRKMENAGFEICERPTIFLSRTVIMKIKHSINGTTT